MGSTSPRSLRPVKLTPVPGFTFRVLWDWPRQHLAPGCKMYADGLACFNAVTLADCAHQPTVVGGLKPKDLPEFQCFNTVPGNLKTSLSGPTTPSPNMRPVISPRLPTGSTGAPIWPHCRSACSLRW